MSVILFGFMGCGKSTVGRQLATRMGLPFLDTDLLVTKAAAKSIPAIFEEEGESGFRKRETEICRTLAVHPAAVIAVGGGTVLNDENVRLLKAIGQMVFLDITEETAVARLALSDNRPLLQGDNPTDTVRQLYRERQLRYRAVADCTVDANGTPFATAAAIMDLVGRR